MTYDYGAKISKDGYSASAVPTDATKKNFIMLDTTEAHKVHHKGYVTSGSYTHGLGIKPIFHVFTTDSTSSPTYFRPTRFARCNTSQITNIPNPSYIVVMNEGV